jgi:hypothetical protein
LRIEKAASAKSSPGPLPFLSAGSDSFLRLARKKPSNFVLAAQSTALFGYARSAA